jgi:heptosyltransferase-2
MCKAGPQKILMRGPNWVGDAVLAIPAMKAVRARFPGAEITLLVRPWVAGLFTSADFIDQLWTEPKPSRFADWPRIARNIRSRQFDLALLFPNSFESALMVFLARVPQRIGYARDGRSWMLTDSIWPSTEERHQVHYYLELAKRISAPVENPSIAIKATIAEKQSAREVLKEAGVPERARYIVLNPGAAYGSAKRWSADRFAETAGILARDYGFRVVIIGSETERPIAEHIQSSGFRETCPPAILNGKTTLECLIGVLSECSLMITNDSGPMHIAAALGVPTVAVFGATNDIATGPWGPRTRVVRHPVACSPCMLRNCPIDHRCMAGVTAMDVCTAARELLAHE